MSERFKARDNLAKAFSNLRDNFWEFEIYNCTFIVRTESTNAFGTQVYVMRIEDDAHIIKTARTRIIMGIDRLLEY